MTIIFQGFFRAASMAALCMVLIAAVPAQAMRSGGWHETKEQAEQRRRDEMKRVAMKVAVITACLVGVGACWYFLGKPSIGYSARTRVNVAGIPIDLAFGADHDAPGCRNSGPRCCRRGNHWGW